MKIKSLIIGGLCLWSSSPLISQESGILLEKTLVVWASPLNLSQRGGTALTIDDGMSRFDGIVFGEIETGKWMAGSNNFERSLREQTDLNPENCAANQFVKIAIVYQDEQIRIYRNDQLYGQYETDRMLDIAANTAVVLFGQRHLDVGDASQSFAGRILDARIYDQALKPETLTSLKPGQKGAGPAPWAWWDFKNTGLQDKTQRFTNFQLLKGAHLDAGALWLPGNGASLIASQNRETSSWKSTDPVPKAVVESTRKFREKLLADPYRPVYHFCVPEDKGYPGDPNGAFFAKGRYHLMYLYNREGSGFCWGHISSSDLLHWRHHPDALYPGEGDEGAFSGGAFVDTDGTAYLTYWMLWGAKGIGMSKSRDAQYDSWEKLSTNPVIASTEWGITEMKDANGTLIHVGSADPSNIWKNNGKFYMLTGNLLVLNKFGRQEGAPKEEQGDRLYLFGSDDLTNWEYQSIFYESDRNWTEASEDNMCPSFLPLPSSPDGGPASDRHLLLFISHNKGCQYYIGRYEKDHFYPESHERMTWNDNAYFAPEALVDEKGRQIMWAWIFDDRPESMQSASGWTGTYSLPRSLWLGQDNTLRISPIRELENLRRNKLEKGPVDLKNKESIQLNEMSHPLMEIAMEIQADKSTKVEVTVGQSADNQEETLVFYDWGSQKLGMDTQKSSLEFGRKTIEEAPLKLAEGEALQLRIFIDRGIIEVFANDKQAISRAVYPTKNGTGIQIKSLNGTAKIKNIETWELSPTNSY